MLAGAVGDLKDTIVIAVVLAHQRRARLRAGGQGRDRDGRPRARCSSPSVRVRRGRRARRGAPPTTWCPATSCCSSPATGCRPTVGCWWRPACRSTSRRSPASRCRSTSGPSRIVAEPGVDLALGDRANLAYMNTTVDAGPGRAGRHRRPAWPPRWARSPSCWPRPSPGPPRCERQLDRSSTRLAMIAVRRGRPGVRAADGRRASTSPTPRWARWRWRWPPSPRACPPSSRSPSPSGSARWPSSNAIVKRLHSVETLGLHHGDLLGQDRHADPQPDDRPRDRASAGVRTVGRRHSAYGDRRARLRAGRAGRRPDARACARAVAARAVQRRRGPRRRARRRPDRGRPGGAGGQGRHRRRRPARRSCPRIGEVPVRLGHQVHGHVPPPIGRRASSGLRQGRTRRAARPVRRPWPTATAPASARRRRRGPRRWPTTTGWRRTGCGSSPWPRAGCRPPTVTLAADGTVVDPDRWIDDLTLEALVGIVDPPRAEARDAIAPVPRGRHRREDDHRRPRHDRRRHRRGARHRRARSSPATSSTAMTDDELADQHRRHRRVRPGVARAQGAGGARRSRPTATSWP